MEMSPDWVIALALAVGAVSFAVVAIIRLKTLIGRKDPDRFSNPQIDAVVDRLEDRIADLELRHQEQIADLEERLEFAERLLTKQREQIGPG